MSDIIELLITSGVLYSIYQSFVAKKKKKKSSEESQTTDSSLSEPSLKTAEEPDFVQSIESLFGISIDPPKEEKTSDPILFTESSEINPLPAAEPKPVEQTPFVAFPVETQMASDEIEFKSAINPPSSIQDSLLTDEPLSDWKIPVTSEPPAYLDLVMNPSSLRDAVIMQEILEKPVSMRRRRF